MNALRLQSSDRDQPDLTLSPGVHALGRDARGRIKRAGDHEDAFAQLCIDRRGIWLQVREDAAGLHVNGRPVRRMAMLRAGDALHLDGTELLLVADEPPPAPRPQGAVQDARMVLRGVGGPYHGRCFPLDRPRLAGRGSECDIRIDEERCAERQARFEACADGVAVRGLEGEACLVNGRSVREALLRPGDQVVFGMRHRFVVEAPVQRGVLAEPVAAPGFDAANDALPAAVSVLPAPVRRLPWLLLAALLLAGALSLLLLYGAR
ncbi:FHA domain-containing protein [Vulcaniibacterium tengchongense]|uniref:FHA domain-containing protein n=1 Tax=Vulcaniibacterium tengchongense TaxID=1273429 RepID=A0A3N4VJ84_9GAMM|nr:FHA domain-containing protein [Vulcaniibacterium tengchongense]RPE81753.1 FHA domain-containing protein [Vulcaniibacterium tengchongense]